MLDEVASKWAQLISTLPIRDVIIFLLSSTALRVAPVIEALKLPQLGYAATSVKLFDYPHFLRTIPADDVQVKVVKALTNRDDACMRLCSDNDLRQTIICCKTG